MALNCFNWTSKILYSKAVVILHSEIFCTLLFVLITFAFPTFWHSRFSAWTPGHPQGGRVKQGGVQTVESEKGPLGEKFSVNFPT